MGHWIRRTGRPANDPVQLLFFGNKILSMAICSGRVVGHFLLDD